MVRAVHGGEHMTAGSWKFAIALAIVGAAACDGDDGGSSSNGSGAGGPGGAGGGAVASCNEDPWSCPAGRTCWPTSTTTFECLNSGVGQAGDDCQNVLSMPSCADGLACLQFEQGAPGTCTPFCDSAHPCPDNAACLTVVLEEGGPTFQVCEPPGGTGGAGGTGGTGGTGGAGGAGGA
jgi:hypothetical protein